MLDELYGAMGNTMIDGVYDKVFSKMRLPQFPLRLPPPYDHASEEQFAKYCAALRARYPAWIV